MSSLYHRLEEKLSEREKENAFRKFVLPNKNLIDFYSNDYLGLAKENHFEVNVSSSWGSTGSRLLGGNSESHEKFEKFLSEFHQCEAALLFNSGYSANTGLFSCLLTKGDTYIFDELCHASIRDGMRLNHATSWSFLHNDVDDLEKKLQLAKGRVVVIVESVYSMDGHFAPLQKIVALKEKYDFDIVVDEAHAVGLFGKQGRGIVNEEQIEDRIFARVITFGKALGSHGAAVLGSEKLKNYLINFSRPFIYTTALPPIAIEHLQYQYETMMKMDEEREKLKSLIQFYRKELIKHSKILKNSLESFSSIQSILIPGNDQVKLVAEKLKQNGLDVRPILSPTVPEGKERLRICLHVFNTEEEIVKLINIISSALSSSF